jgi:hypothetical protein
VHVVILRRRLADKRGYILITFRVHQGAIFIAGNTVLVIGIVWFPRNFVFRDPEWFDGDLFLSTFISIAAFFSIWRSDIECASPVAS